MLEFVEAEEEDPKDKYLISYFYFIFSNYIMATRKYKKKGGSKVRKPTPRKSKSSSRQRKKKQRLTGAEERAKNQYIKGFNGRPYE